MELANCSHCGSDKVHDGTRGMNPAAKRVTCLNCNSSSPALEIWNTRADLASAGDGERVEATLREAAKLVCGYCDGHFPQWKREATRGVSGSGNWVHRKKGDASHPAPVICAATGIYNRIECDRATKGTKA